MITRRHFLATTAAAGVAGTAVAAPVVAPVLTPDERIAAAVEMIKEAYQAKFPGAPIRICMDDADELDMVIVMPFQSREQTGVVTYLRNSKVVRREGGAA